MGGLNLQFIKSGLNWNKFLSLFVLLHVLFAITLGRLFAFAPDEAGYLYTFNNMYGSGSDPNPQYSSGWISVPKIFLWIAYLPAKTINILGVPDYLSIRILSIILASLSLYLLMRVLKEVIGPYGFTRNALFLSFLIPSVFLWTSVALRESFIFLEISMFLIGLHYLMQGRNNLSVPLLFLALMH